MSKKKIAFLATGGTIACVPGPSGMRPVFTEKEMLDLVPELSDIADIKGSLIMNIDSSNMMPEDWSVIAQKTAKALDEFDGVVISHGTDTLAYTSSALTYMLSYLKKPVVITGSQKSIGEKQNDAKQNLMDSFRVAVTGKAGVFVVFYGKIIVGDRAAKMKTTSFDAFESVNAPDVGRVEGKTVEWNEKILEQEKKRIEKIWSGSTPISIKRDAVTVNPQIDPEVLLVKLYPGIKPDILQLAKDKGYHSVLIEGFGSGGVPFREPGNLIPTIEELISSGITVAVTTQVPLEGVDLSLYEVGKKALEIGAISTGDMTREAALVRLMMKKL